MIVVMIAVVLVVGYIVVSDLSLPEERMVLTINSDQKAALLKTLQELQFGFEMGKLSLQEFETQQALLYKELSPYLAKK